jgi:hypothetical protein
VCWSTVLGLEVSVSFNPGLAIDILVAFVLPPFFCGDEILKRSAASLILQVYVYHLFISETRFHSIEHGFVQPNHDSDLNCSPRRLQSIIEYSSRGKQHKWLFVDATLPA